MALAVEPAVLLIGAGSDVFRAGIVARYPALASRIHATGVVDESAIGGLMAECDLFVQPYPDGVTCRRTSLMTCLARGVPVVTTSGRLTEALWAESGAVAMADAADVPAFTAIVNGLIGDAGSRGRLGAQGQALYRQRFDIGHAVRLLRGAVALPAVRQCA
jgi:glycosyltransferase involved in cell wall biosynthesis